MNCHPAERKNNMNTPVQDTSARKLNVVTLSSDLLPPRLSPHEAAELRVIAAARRLPDDMFADHPDIARLAAAAKAQKARFEGLVNTTSGASTAAILALQERLIASEGRVSEAAIDDALAGDFEFSSANAEMQEIERLGRQIKAAILANEAISLSPPQRREIYADRAQRARSALENRLHELKLEHVRNHPELLENI